MRRCRASVAYPERRFRLIRAALLVAGCALLSGCVVSADATQSSLAGRGLRDIKIGLPAPGVCDWNQKTGRHYTAINERTGKTVSGVMCTNVFEDDAMNHPDQRW